MKKKLIELKTDFLIKRKQLERARIALKTEFIGIDIVIDQVIDNVSSWHSFDSLQDKPIVINLWGLTGVGKTSLINRLVDLIGYRDRYFKFDMGAKESHLSFDRALSDLCENKDDSPIIITLDEFQHSRTVKGPMREEIDSDKNRLVWELIDSGKVNYIDWKRGVWHFEDLIKKMQHLLAAGVVVKNGIVTEGEEVYLKEMHQRKSKDKPLLFYPAEEYNYIIEFSSESMCIDLLKDVSSTLKKLEGVETILFLKKLLTIAKRPSTKNFSKSLIFVLGNIDEAYTMSNNYSADVSADEFHELSKKITIPKMKSALQMRFRDEQIARLGNIHIIYPALNKVAFMGIIRLELAKISEKIDLELELKLIFEQSLQEMIYSEGVYPTQGVRPIFTTIHQMFKSKLSQFISELLDKDLIIDTLSFSVHQEELKCAFINAGETIFTKSIKLDLQLENLRKSKHDDMQAITAVHESGHAVLSAVLLRVVPEAIYSVSSDADNSGFMYSKRKWDYISRKELIPTVAMMLGGHIAEELIFGKENVTSGSTSDIDRATSFLANMLKKAGMGEAQIRYQLPYKENGEGYNNYKSIEEELKAMLLEATELARATLKKEIKLLLVLSNYLSDERCIKHFALKELISSHLEAKVEFITDGRLTFYRNHLKKQVESHLIEVPLNLGNVINLNNRLDETGS